MSENAKVTYEIVPHDGRWAYRVGDTWSESFPTREVAETAAWAAAREQAQEGETELIEFQDADGIWHTELSDGADRPEAGVETPGSGERKARRFSINPRRAKYRAGQIEDHDGDPDYGDRPRVYFADSVRELIRDHPFKITLSAALASVIVGFLSSRNRR